MIVTINFERVKGIVGDISEYFTHYSKHDQISLTSLVSNVLLLAAPHGTLPTLKSVNNAILNINNTLNTKLHYSIEIKMLQSGVF